MDSSAKRILTKAANCGTIRQTKNRGVAQLVARDVWDVDAAGSNPVTPMKNQPERRQHVPLSADFFRIAKIFFKNLLTLPLTVMIYLTCKKETALFLPLQNPMKGRGYV